MNHIQIINKFIKEKKTLDEVTPSGLPFVTISRQAGAGGHLLAYVILTDFLKHHKDEVFQGWHVFDKQLCEVIAEDPALRDSVEGLVNEEYRSEFQEFIESFFTGLPQQYLLYKATSRVVRVLASIGKVVIVGRGGACVTRDLRGGIHLRLVAPESERIMWMMKRFRIKKDEARKLMVKQDRDRQLLMKKFFNRDIDDSMLYDLVVNTSRVDLHEISHTVIEMIQNRAKGVLPTTSMGRE
jgi:cytidylate kinase